MPEQALYLKWRPVDFDDMVGQEHITHTLRNSLKTGRIRHAYLFSGPRGTGKTSSARLLAKAVNCLHADPQMRPCNACANCVAVNEGRFLDLIEIDAASHTGVDDVRELRDRIAFAPNEGKYKVYIIDEVHRFSGNAFDALLKTLEEPPDHAIFVLATTEIDRVPATIKSRCLQFEFRRVSLRQVTARLRAIADAEGLHIEDAALELIARQGTGSVRDSISLLDQIVADPQEVITLELTERILGTASTRAVRALMEALVAQDISQGLHILHQAVDAGSDPRQFCQQVVEHLRAILLAQTAGADLVEASVDDRQMYSQQARYLKRPMLLKAIRAFNEFGSSPNSSWQPQLALELAWIETFQEPEVAVMPVQATAYAGAGAKTTSTPSAKDDFQPAEPTQLGTPPIMPLTEVQMLWEKARGFLANQENAQTQQLSLVIANYNPALIDGNRVYVPVDSQSSMSILDLRVRWIEKALYLMGDKKKLTVHFVKPEELPYSQGRHHRSDESNLDDYITGMGGIKVAPRPDEL